MKRMNMAFYKEIADIRSSYGGTEYDSRTKLEQAT